MKKWLKLGANTSFGFSKRLIENGAFYQFITRSPLARVKDANGNWTPYINTNNDSNPVYSALHDSLPKNSGIVDPLEVPFAVRKYSDRIVYEAAFSRRAVSPFKLIPYSTMRASLIVNLNNGKERVGFLELTPGIGQQPKRPDQWMDLVLLP